MKTTCCIVGGGPGGAILALLLARSGIPVTLLEMHKHFDREFRGDSIHPSVMEILDQIGLADKLLELPHSKVRTLNLVSTSGPIASVNFDFLKTKYPYITFLPQVKFLDFITAEASRYPNFKLMMSANAHELIQENGVVKGVRYRAEDGNDHELQADLTVGADGRSSHIRKLIGAEPIKTSPPMDVLWFRLPRRVEDGEGVAGRFGSGRILVMLDRLDQWQVGYVIPKGNYHKLRAAGLGELKKAIGELAPELKDRVDFLKDWDQVGVLSVESSRVPRWYFPGLLLIGDAAHVMSPVAGVGINYAIQDAVVAANVLTFPLKKGNLKVSDLRKVQCRRVWPTRIIQAFQTMIQNRLIAQALVSSGAFNPPIFFRFKFFRKLLAKMIAFGPFPVRIRKGILNLTKP